MTDQVEFITLNEGEKTECEARIHVIEGVSITIDLMDFSRNPSVEEILAFAEETFKTVIDDTLSVHPRVHFQISASAHMEKVNGERVPFVEITNKRVFLYRHRHHRERAIREQFMKISNPQHHAETYGDVQIENDTSGSSFAFPTAIDQIRLSLITPLHYNPRALGTGLRLKAGQKFAKHLDTVPYNNDKYCFLHCLFNSLYEAPEVKKFRNLNLNKEYSACFQNFLVENKLEDFYSGDNFLIDDVALLESRLKCSINVFRENDGEVELYYRSNFHYGADDPVNILLLPLSVFENTREGAPQPAPNCEAIRQVVDLKNKKFLGKISTTEFVNTLEAHAVVLNSSFFRAYKGGVVCKYCHCTKDKKIDISTHEENCLQLHRGIPLRERVRNYKECKDPRKIFDRYSAFYRVPYCTYDFETRIVKTELPGGKVVNRHVPYSFSILYLNVFDVSKSKIFLEKDLDPVVLIEKFVAICKNLTRYHHDEVQCVDFAVNRPRLTNEVRNAGCPWCLETFDAGKRTPEFNHSHFEGDTLNTEHDRYICKSCNQKCKIRDKPLKFYAHNGSKYDQQLFLPTFLNDAEIKTHSFLNKSESRFTEVRLGFGYSDVRGNSRYKLSFNDSMMLLSETLAKNCAAWISQSDRDTLTTLMGVFYKDIPRENLKPLVDLSFKKQVFPYSALNVETLLESTKPIAKEHFANTFLMDKECTEGDYGEYLVANETLASVLKDSTFGDFHDYYLLLDVVLLGIILRNFQNLNSNLSGLNPLMFLSTSAYSFNALLKHNKYSPTAIPEIIIPEVDIQRFVRRGIKGGFTQIFNKTNLKGPDDLSFGSDFTSLYPTIMNKCKLPHEFSHWLSLEDKTTEEILEEISGSDDGLYFFIDCDIAALGPEFQGKVSNYPMFPETQTISADDYSEDQLVRNFLSSGVDSFGDQTLNTTSFYAKKAYVTSWSYLKQAIAVGYRVTAINRVAVFKADFIMSDYINEVYKLKETATAQRNEMQPGTPEYDAICARIVVYKLILNGIYGFTIVNSDSHKEADLLDIEKENTVLHRRVSSPRFIGMLRVGNKVVVNQMKTQYTLEYPLMVGAAILWESKLLTARYIFALYEWLKKLSNLEVYPLFYDTDSCYVSIKNFRKEFKSIQDFCFRFNKEVYKLFDTSGFPEGMQHKETHNSLGYMTLEADGTEITDFAGVAAKCYSYCYGEEVVTKGKGISKALQKQYLNFTLYQKIVDGSIFQDFNREKYSCSFREFRNTGFSIETKDSAKCFATLVDLKTFNIGGKEPKWAVFGSEKHKLLLSQEHD